MRLVFASTNCSYLISSLVCISKTLRNSRST
nr:MAG TPA: hypothetical protein [Caudoviricetes sp.]